MNRSVNFLGFVTMLAAAAIALAAGSAFGQVAPARVNAGSIRSTQGQPLMQASHASPAGQPQFFSFSQGRMAQRPGFYPAAGTQQAQFVQPRQGQGAEPTPPPLPMPGTEDEAAPEEVQGEPEGIVEAAPYDGEFIEGDGGYCGDCGPMGCSKCGGKGGKGDHDGYFHDWNWVCICLPLPPDDNLAVNFGVQGFKGPLNTGLDSSFGFHEGFNLGASLPLCCGEIGWQLGLNATQSNLSGSDFATADERNQLFSTVGLFRRVDCGLQGGVVFDHLHDDWHYDIDLSQIRGELSWVYSCCHEFGFFFNASTGSDDIDSEIINQIGGQEPYQAEATDLFAMFYRHQFDDCGMTYGRIWLGVTGERLIFQGPGINDPEFQKKSVAAVGADVHVGLGEHWALESGFAYLIPSRDNIGAAIEESWNIGINVVWYPHGVTNGTCKSYFRPLMNVADNGTFFTNFK